MAGARLWATLVHRIKWQVCLAAGLFATRIFVLNQAMPMPNQHTVFFDGDCGFCQRSVRIVRRLDWLRQFRYETLQGQRTLESGLLTSAPGCGDIPGELIVQAPASQSSDGARWGGWRGLKRIWFRLPLFYVLFAVVGWLNIWLAVAVLLALSPLGNPVGATVYRWIARNRHRLSGSQCRLENP